MKTLRRILVLLIVAGVAAYGYWMYLPGKQPPVPANVVRISGNIEVTDAEISFKIPGLVVARLVDEGEIVTKDQLIARLESSDLEQEVALRASELKAEEAVLAELLAGSRPEEIAEAQAEMEHAQALLDEKQAGSRPQEVASAEAALARARAEARNSGLEFKRQEELYRQGVTSADAFDRARMNLEVARARVREAEEALKLIQEGPRREEIERARAELAEARERHSRIQKGPRAETIAQARAGVQKARSALTLARTRLGYAEVRSPMPGVVLSKNIEPGEYVSPGTPIVTVGDLANVWVRGYINETDLGRVKLGQSVEVSIDTFPGKRYTGRISFIAPQAEFTPKNVQTEQERVKLVYRVKVDIPNPDRELKPGMPADADILLE